MRYRCPELAADESVILAYWQLRDGVADHDWLHGLKYRSALSFGTGLPKGGSAPAGF
ncbi:MAG: hypothetical protein V8R55_00550 [Dysosmobacter sp.]